MQRSTLYPSHVLPAYWKASFWVLGTLILLVLQILSGTNPLYALLVVVFMLQFGLILRALGGVTTLTGCCFFLLGMQNVIVSQVAKIYFWEPADLRLMHPLETLGIYNLFLAGAGLAVLTLRRSFLAKRRPLFEPEVDLQRLMWMAYILTALGIVQTLFTGTQNIDADSGQVAIGGINGAVKAVHGLVPLSIVVGTAYTILASRGRKNLGIANGIMMIVTFLGGIVTASREGIIFSVLLYIVTCFAFGFRFRPHHYVSFLGIAFIAQFIMFPYALYARGLVRTPRMDENVRRATDLMLDILNDPFKYQKIVNQKPDRSWNYKKHYYPSPNSTLERFSLIVMNDAIVDATLREGTVGLATILPGVEMATPRIFLPDKRVKSTSNMLAHREPGLVGKDDMTTGISIGPVADAFSSFGWPGAFSIGYLMTLLYFGAWRFIISDSLKNNVFPICMIFAVPWGYSEAPLASNISFIFQEVPVYAVTLFVVGQLVNVALRTQLRLQATKRHATRPVLEGRMARYQRLINETKMLEYSSRIATGKSNSDE